MRWRIVIFAALVGLVAAACGGDGGDGGSNGDGDGTRAAPTVAASADDGKVLYDGTCVACHAEAGAGIDGLGKALANNDYVKGLSDDALVEFIKVGRGASDPENVTGIAMPAKGGNPALSDADLAAIVAYLRTLN